MNKIKIFNDPVHGIIRFKYELLYDIIDHPVFQRLRRISQMGLSNLVYPGANHTRFEHALGALHLMTRALDVLKEKGVTISEEEYLASCIAILCHDLGHGPFSHALEGLLLPIPHEEISIQLIGMLAEDLDGPFELSIKIFKDQYERKFFSQLVGSQLDMDRLDYLSRDSFYSGVVEGRVGYDRLIMMLNVAEERLVVEEKGISSVEKFLFSRHMMYSQVYLHKTSLVAEKMLQSFIQMCKKYVNDEKIVNWDENLLKVVKTTHIDRSNTYNSVLQHFITLDDTNVKIMLKNNVKSRELGVKILSKSIVERKLFKLYLHQSKEKDDRIKILKKHVSADFFDVGSLIFEMKSNIYLYSKSNQPIQLLMKNGKIEEFSQVTKLNIFNRLPESNFVVLPTIEHFNNL